MGPAEMDAVSTTPTARSVEPDELPSATDQGAGPGPRVIGSPVAVHVAGAGGRGSLGSPRTISPMMLR
jgi:hypothetical protein